MCMCVRESSCTNLSKEQSKKDDIKKKKIIRLVLATYRQSFLLSHTEMWIMP